MSTIGKHNINFVTLEVSVAAGTNYSICEVGLAVVRNAEIIDKHRWLIRPEGNWFNEDRIKEHGITPEMTQDAPLFRKVWPEIKAILDGNILVIHDSLLQLLCLHEALTESHIEHPEYTFYSTAKLSFAIQKEIGKHLDDHKLVSVCDELRIPLEQNNNAEHRAVACARIMLKFFEMGEVGSFTALRRKYRFNAGRFWKQGVYAQRPVKKQNAIDPDKPKVNRFITSLEGKKICLSGEFVGATHDDFKCFIRFHGGIPMDSVTNETDILVIGQDDCKYGPATTETPKRIERAYDLFKRGADIAIMSQNEAEALTPHKIKDDAQGVIYLTEPLGFTMPDYPPFLPFSPAFQYKQTFGSICLPECCRVPYIQFGNCRIQVKQVKEQEEGEYKVLIEPPTEETETYIDPRDNQKRNIIDCGGFMLSLDDEKEEDKAETVEIVEERQEVQLKAVTIEPLPEKKLPVKEKEKPCDKTNYFKSEEYKRKCHEHWEYCRKNYLIYRGDFADEFDEEGKELDRHEKKKQLALNIIVTIIAVVIVILIAIIGIGIAVFFLPLLAGAFAKKR